MATNDQKNQIGRLWDLLQSKDLQVIELRAFHKTSVSSLRVNHFRNCTYDSPVEARAAFENDALELNAQGYNVYTPLNPIKHDFCGKAVKDSDILSRRLLLIDVDRVADTKQPATVEDMNSAENLAENVAAFLAEKGWPNPARMMSGNGFHLYFPLDDLPNTEKVTALVRGTLKELSRRFDTNTVRIDTSVFNASRITKVPGTIMRKGEATEGRPYRMAKLLSEFANTRVTESMLAEIVAPGETTLNAPSKTPRKLLGPDSSVAITTVQLKSALSSISSHTRRGNGSIDLVEPKDYWLGVVWAIAGLDLNEGKEIAREWSSQSSLYTAEGFETAWDSFDPNHPNPIGIGSVVKLAKTLEAQATTSTFLQKLQAWSSTGNSQVMIQKLLEDKFVLEEIAILGEWTTIYASHNVGKTLLTLRLLIDSVKSGNLDGRNIFYINADDSYKGSVEKLSIAEKYGIEMLLPNQNNFKPGTFVEELGQATRNDEAREIVVILDTLKKFTDLMNKTESTHFGKIAREFVQAGGTIIGLAHTNKHPDESGKKIYSGTTDIADDCDCYHIIELIEDNKASGRRVIQSRCDKPRGAVALEKTFYYVRKQETSYEDLLNSFSVMDQETARQEKRSIKKKRQYYEDKRVIDSIIGFASQEEVELTELIKKVASDTQIGRGKCRDVVERYKGELLDEFTFWKILKGPRNRKTLEILSWDLGQPKN